MKYLLDTGILLRLVHPVDPLHQTVCTVLDALKDQGHTLYCGMRNISEFWNVTTRPAAARGGFGLIPEEARKRLAIIERAVEVLTDSQTSYIEWKRLIVLHAVCGVQVHDARLAALMNINGIRHLLTLNPVDFTRFTELVITTPNEIIQSGVGRGFGAR